MNLKLSSLINHLDCSNIESSVTPSRTSIPISYGEAGGLLSQFLEYVVVETVHDSHGLARDPYVGMYLFQNLKDTDLVRLHALVLPLLLILISDSNGGVGFLSTVAFMTFFSSARFFSVMGAIEIRREKSDFGKGNWEI
ncbi:hypothetical protein Vadar_032881 [Vaccinium darrowii]|uniref:Uncharacterized protein n=1 Tax=Vaccinium darrowii TaxID=229202 RepID=A0ACB7XLJ5_9ERIC|nr:hypothetical protein Vadar_032881 [Vaccinium darrowii]